MSAQNNENDRSFMWHDHLSLWFSLGVGLLVIQMGSFLAPAMGTKDAILAIVLGSVIGAGILAYTARLGQQTNLNSAHLMQNVFGTGFARLPIILNIIQLLGWTAFELVIMSEGTIAVIGKAFGTIIDGFIARAIIVLIWSALLFLMINGAMVKMVRNFASKFILPLVLLSLIWLSIQFIGMIKGDIGTFLAQKGDGSMSLLAAMDLVIAMPISWLPLVCDYSKHGRSPRSTLSGTWLGYAFANIWCYGLGFLIISVAPSDIGMVATILLAQGGLLALGIILFDELDNAYGDTYSGAISLASLMQNENFKKSAMAIILGAGLCAIFLPMHDLEKFLISLSSVFVPLYGIILGRFAKTGIEFNQNQKYVWQLAILWVVGVAIFQTLTRIAPNIGATLPSFALMFVGAYLLSLKQNT